MRAVFLRQCHGVPATKRSLPSAARAVLSVAVPFRRGGDAAGLPQRLKILDWGTNTGRTTGARILVDDVVAQTLSANQQLVACDRVPMDYEHQSVKGHPNYQPDPRYSPGHGEIEVVPGEGVFLSAISYSSNGEELADSYTDVSAVVHLDKDGRPLWISSVALTQRGDVAGMEFSEAVAALSAQDPSQSPNPENQMDTPDETKFRDLLIALLKLTPGDTGEVTDEEIIAAVEKQSGSAPVSPADAATETAACAAVVPEADATAILNARMDTFERHRLVDLATREGKVIPLSAEDIAATPVAVLSAMIEKLAAGEVPLDGTSAKRELPATHAAALSADEARAAKALGLTDEEYRKSTTATV